MLGLIFIEIDDDQPRFSGCGASDREEKRLLIFDLMEDIRQKIDIRAAREAGFSGRREDRLDLGQPLLQGGEDEVGDHFRRDINADGFASGADPDGGREGEKSRPAADVYESVTGIKPDLGKDFSRWKAPAALG